MPKRQEDEKDEKDPLKITTPLRKRKHWKERRAKTDLDDEKRRVTSSIDKKARTRRAKVLASTIARWSKDMHRVNPRLPNMDDEDQDEEMTSDMGAPAAQSEDQRVALLQQQLDDVRKSTSKLDPPKTCDMGNVREIFQEDRPNFQPTFYEQFWDDQFDADGHATCSICNGTIVRGDKSTGKGRSIDHVKPWSENRQEIDTYIVCCNGSHWQVMLTDDVMAKYQDLRNLKPAHKSCNSGKGGSTETDSIRPQRLGDCPAPQGACDCVKGQS
jgi:hypothetical protein